jgi:hypothetical protein
LNDPTDPISEAQTDKIIQFGGPRFQCDRCGNIITDAQGGLLLWDEHGKSQTLVCSKCAYNSYLNDIKAGDIMQDEVGDLWKVVGQHDDRIACFDEPIDDCFDELPWISLFTWETFSRMTFVRTDPPPPQ